VVKRFQKKIGRDLEYKAVLPGEVNATNEARRLFAEYAESLDFSLCFQGFDRELEGLPGEYAPPSGRLILAILGDSQAGCAALRKINESTCEMKRLYVRPEFRKKGIGRELAEQIIKVARQIGYKRMRLDTVPAMKEAVSLYHSLGFTEIAPYGENPIPGALFMELDLFRNAEKNS
jgi:putative acetyltransferase